MFRFDGTNWNEEAKLLASDGAEDDRFGCSVAVAGDWAVVGAMRDDDNGAASGSAYVFAFDGSAWVEHQKLLPADNAEGDAFGVSAAMTEGTIIVGAAYKTHEVADWAGAAYVFRLDGSQWVEEAKLLASDGSAEDYFGRSVSICGDTAVIGAVEDDTYQEDAGSAYIFRFDGTE